jgi:uncharacterized protein (TIGR00375 family)
LKSDIEKICDKSIPESCRNKVRFILNSEISCIYKKNSKTRKIHNLIFLPNLADAEIMNRKLAHIGNIAADGRPILGLDAKNLLEMVLETGDQAYMVPAHIWTPWFSLLGSKSGFDSLNECFEDLSDHIFAVETGLSSDPIMNWRVSFLDSVTLISNSDAHSPDKLGREANIFDTELSYFAIKEALENKTSRKFLGTYEFYPEEGKYYFDGHRNCGIRFSPENTFAHDGKCPVCNKRLTIGVLNRVEELSDRKIGERPQHVLSFFSRIPLKEIIAEVLNIGINTKKVMKYYWHSITALGPELDILDTVELLKILKIGIPLLTEAIQRTRTGRVYITPGYDGEFGKIRIFDEKEKDSYSKII